MRRPSLKQGSRGWTTSSTAVPTRHRSPTSAPDTSSPAVVRFSPNGAGPSPRPSSASQSRISSLAYAYTALSGPPWSERSAWSSPSRLTPRTATRPSTGDFQIAVVTVRRPVATGRGRPTFTLRRRATAPIVTSHAERGDRLPDFDDVGRQHATGAGAEVERVVWCARRDQERIAGAQRERVAPLDIHPHRAGEDVADLLAGMHVPARRDALRDLGEDLHDLPAGDRGCAVLELGALELAGELVGGHGLGRHERSSLVVSSTRWRRRARARAGRRGARGCRRGRV